MLFRSGLYGMDNEDEIECFRVGNAIEDEHGLNGEMPRACTIRRRNDDCNGANHECYHSTGQSEMLCKIEAEKRQVVVQEVAGPNAKSKAHEERYVANMTQRDDALPNAAERRTYLIIYRKVT